MKRERNKGITSKQIAVLAREAAVEKKANEATILEMKGLSSVTDYFVIASGSSNVHIRTIANAIEERLDKERVKISHIEGYKVARWVLLDYGDVIIHIFCEAARSFYDLEGLWADAKVIR